MDPEKRFDARDAFLEKSRLKYNLKKPDLGFDSPNTRSPEIPQFDPKKMNLESYSGPWGNAQITHLIRRTKFGVSRQDLEFFSTMDMEDSVNLLLTEAPVPSPPVNDYNNGEDVYDPVIGFGETWVNETYSQDFEGERVVSLKRWWINNMLTQSHSITEKMMLFWHNHIVTEWWGVYVASASYRYMEILRKFQMGDFKELIKSITIDTSMLIYLNGASNVKDAPDENYARELQELFCIGKGPNAKFSEADVQAAARVLTGWTVTWPEFEQKYDAWNHDTGDKQFSEFYDNKLIEGRGGTDGPQELDDLINMIFDNSETALFICRKLYTFFVYPQITEEVETNIIAPLAELLRESDYVIKPVLEKLLKSQHFYDESIKGSIIKDPCNALIGNWRTLQPPVPYKDDLYAYSQLLNSMHWTMYNHGMELGDPPNVAGWAAYYQIPIFDKGWITTNTITARALITDSIIYWGFWSASGQIPTDLLALVDSMDTPGDPNALIDQIFTLFLGIEVGDITRDRIKDILLSNQEQDYYWTNAWSDYKSDPSNEFYKATVENRLKWSFQRILQMAESQLQ